MAYKKKTYDIMSQAEKDLRAEYKVLAKRADQRLVRLEKYAERDKYSDIKTWAYANARYDIQSFFGTDAKRFNKALKVSLRYEQVLARVNAVRRFLESETSSIAPVKEDVEYGIKAIQGVDSLYERRVNSFNKTMGTDFTWQEFAEFMNSKQYERVVEQLGYGVAKMRLGRIKETREKIVEDMKNSKRPGRINNPKLVTQAITRELTKGKATAEELEQARGILPKEKKVRRKRRK